MIIKYAQQYAKLLTYTLSLGFLNVLTTIIDYCIIYFNIVPWNAYVKQICKLVYM